MIVMIQWGCQSTILSAEQSLLSVDLPQSVQDKLYKSIKMMSLLDGIA